MGAYVCTPLATIQVSGVRGNLRSESRVLRIHETWSACNSNRASTGTCSVI